MSFFPACPASSSSIWCHHWNTLPRLLLSSTRVYRRGHLLTFLMKIFNLHTKMLLNQLIKSNDIWDEKRKYNKTEIQSLLKIHHRKRQLTMFSAKTWPYTVCASGSLHLIFTPLRAMNTMRETEEFRWGFSNLTNLPQKGDWGGVMGWQNILHSTAIYFLCC